MNRYPGVEFTEGGFYTVRRCHRWTPSYGKLSSFLESSRPNPLSPVILLQWEPWFPVVPWPPGLEVPSDPQVREQMPQTKTSSWALWFPNTSNLYSENKPNIVRISPLLRHGRQVKWRWEILSKMEVSLCVLWFHDSVRSPVGLVWRVFEDLLCLLPTGCVSSPSDLSPGSLTPVCLVPTLDHVHWAYFLSP